MNQVSSRTHSTRSARADAVHLAPSRTSLAPPARDHRTLLTGFHARRRAEREQRKAAIDGKLGLHGIKTTAPLADQAELRSKVGVPDDAKDSVAGTYKEEYRPVQTVVDHEDVPGPKPAQGTVPNVEPLKHRPGTSDRRMSPHLVTMCVQCIRILLELRD